MRQPRHRRAIRRGDIRLIDDRRLHGIVGKLLKDQDVADLTSRQEWLFEQCVLELERRWRALPAGQRCSCEYCVPGTYIIP